MKCITVYIIRLKCELLVSDDLFFCIHLFLIKNFDEMHGEGFVLLILAHNVVHN